jgi:hypothetical protein
MEWAILRPAYYASNASNCDVYGELNLSSGEIIMRKYSLLADVPDVMT